MRLAAQIKGGFYPAQPAAVAEASERLRLPAGPCAFFDPCAGQGAAIKQLTGLLGVQDRLVYACELDEGRARELRHTLPNGVVIGPADCQTATISAASFGFIWCNPPFDDELGGGQRVEYSFLARATQLLQKDGVMFLVCPEHTAANHDVRKHFLTWYQELSNWDWPEDHRPFNEAIVAGRKRGRPVEGSQLDWWNECSQEPLTYELPIAPGPKRFEKGGFTEPELSWAMSQSRLKRLFRPPSPLPVPAPGLQLSHGQRALVLAGGFLNRVLQLPGQAAILIKASPMKEEFLKSRTEEENEKTGAIKTTTVKSEKIKLLVRVLDTDGRITELK